MLNKLKSISKIVFDFVEVEKPTYLLLFFRIGISLICIVKFLVVRSAFLTLFAQYGLLQWAISKLVSFPFFPHMGNMALFLSRHFAMPVNQATGLLLWVFVVFCIFLLFGFLTRLSTFVCFVLHLAFLNTGYVFMYGVDSFTQISLFYALFFPLNTTWSVDAIMGISKCRAKSVATGIFVRLFQFQLCIVYLVSSIEKMRGTNWLHGDAIWRVLMMPSVRLYDFSWMAQFPVISLLLGYGVLIIEFGYAFMMWRRQVRVAWLLLVVSLHLGIAVFMGLWVFALVMIFLSVFAFGDDVLSDIKSWRRAHRKKASALEVVCT